MTVLLTVMVFISVVVFMNSTDPYRCGQLPSAIEPHAQRVGLIDSLAAEYPNPDFVQSVSSLSTSAGYSFDYFPPEKSTIDTFVHLAQKRYSIIIFRTHGTPNLPVLVTYDPYSQDQRTWDQLNGRLQRVQVEGKEVFGVTGGFVRDTMCGSFPGTIIMVSGCLTMSGDLGPSFINKGARAFIGWTGMVTLEHTDLVFQELLGLLLNGISAREAVDRVMAIDGTDLATGAALGSLVEA